MANSANGNNTWLELPGMKSGKLLYDRNTGHVYTHPDLKCADSQLFAIKIHLPFCAYYLKRTLPSINCKATPETGDVHNKGHGPPGRSEMELLAFWWQVVLCMLSKYKDKSGDDVVKIVYQEWPFNTKKCFQPNKLATIMRSTLERYRQLADAKPRSVQGMLRATFLKSHHQFKLELFKLELMENKDWWVPHEEGGNPRICCNLRTASSDETTDGELTTSSSPTIDPDSLTGMKLVLEAAQNEADQLRRALTYLNYSIVTNEPELTQQRIDDIIKMGESAEIAGIKPGYLFSSSSDDPESIDDESAMKSGKTLLADSTNPKLSFPLFTSRPMMISGLPSEINEAPSHAILTGTGEVIVGEINQLVKQVRFAEALVKESMKIGCRNQKDMHAVPLTKRSESSSTFERFVFGQADDQVEHRTVLMLGVSGSCQTKFINGIVNFFFNVEHNDKFRFQLIEEDATDETDCVKVYDIHHVKGFRVPFSLTIIDTPSHGSDNLELFRDKQTVKLLLEFFKDEAGIKELDMICFVMKETALFNSVLSIFDKDVQDNISCFLPGDYLSDDCNWQQVSQNFFSLLSRMKPKSISLTLQLLEVMDRLKESVMSVQSIFEIRSCKMKEMENAKMLVATCADQIKANENKSDDAQGKDEIEIKWTCILSGAQDLHNNLQLDLDKNKNEMFEHFLNVLRCIQHLKKNSRSNPFLTQKLLDFIFEIEQELNISPT